VDPPVLSIVVVAYRQVELLLECLEACTAAASKVVGRAELIVVDNGGLAPLVRERCLSARLVEPRRNTGFAGGVSLGIAAARGRWIALVNDDARIEPNSLAALLAAGDRAKRIGSVAAQVRFAGTSEIINSAGIAVHRLGIATERFAGAPIAAASGATEVFGATAACALYRRAMLDEIGGFDERFFAYMEDVDVAWRARAAGWSCVYEPRAVAYHQGSSSSGHSSPTKYFLVGRNRVWLLARNATTLQLLRALPGIFVYDSAYVVYVALTDRTLAPLRGRLAGLRGWRARRRELRERRREVELGRGGWRHALDQHRAYRRPGPRK
jgi:GT2 family glycosyltransferase